MSSPERFTHVFAAGCLTIRLHNQDIFRQTEATIRLAAELIDSLQPKATLFDFRAVPPPTSFMDRYQLGEMAGRYLANRPIAALLRPDQADRQQIGKMVALNRGAIVEVFTDPAAAEAWLREHARPDPVP